MRPASASSDSELVPQRTMAIHLKVSLETLWRWSTHGVNGRKLQRIKQGGRVYYTWDAIRAFQVVTNELEYKKPVKPDTRDAREYLKSRGFKL